MTFVVAQAEEETGAGGFIRTTIRSAAPVRQTPGSPEELLVGRLRALVLL